MDSEREEILALHDDERSQVLNRNVRISLEGVAFDVETEGEEIDEGVDIIVSGIAQVRRDIQAMAYYEGKLDSDTFASLNDYLTEMLRGNFVLSSYTKKVARALMTLILDIPKTVLGEEVSRRIEKQRVLNRCCFQIWENLQDGTLWVEDAPTDKLGADFEESLAHLQDIILQRDPRHCDRILA